MVIDEKILGGILIAATFLTGLSAGLCFTWSNAVTTGLSRLDTPGYLAAFQQMNRTIINPTFVLVFFGPSLFHLAYILLSKGHLGSAGTLVLTAAVLYFAGLVLVTIMGNVPINELLDKTELASASQDKLNFLRDSFETKWSRLHLVRTITSSISFLLLLIAMSLGKMS